MGWPLESGCGEGEETTVGEEIKGRGWTVDGGWIGACVPVVVGKEPERCTIIVVGVEGGGGGGFGYVLEGEEW